MIHSDAYLDLRQDLFHVCVFVTVNSLLVNFLPSAVRFVRYPKLFFLYSHLIDIMAGFALNLRVHLPSLDLEIMGFKLRRSPEHWDTVVRNDARVTAFINLLAKQNARKLAREKLMTLVMFNIRAFFSKYSAITHLLLAAWNGFIASWATKTTQTFYGVSISATKTVDWIQLHTHMPTWFLGVLTFVLNALLVYNNFKTDQAKEESAKKRLGLVAQ